MARTAATLLCALAACATGASGPPVTEPGAPPPTTAPVPPPEGPIRPDAPPADGEDLETDADAVGVRRLWRSTRSGIEAPERLVVWDQSALPGLWQRLGAEDPPVVDFERELVVVVAAGQQPTGGHSISVGRTVLRDGVLVVEVVETVPSPDCVTTQAITQPVDVVAVATEGVKKWRFVEREEVGGCGGS